MRVAAGFLTDQKGTSAVEFALVAGPFLTLILAFFQFVFLHYTQQLLSDALYTSASNPETELITENQSDYTKKFCNKMVFKTTCLDSTKGVKIELMKLSDVPTSATAITGSSFDSGAAGDVLVLRARMPTLQIVPFVPILIASDSVIFRR